MTKDEFYMGKALEEARLAAAVGEIPIGAVIIYQKKSDCPRIQFARKPPLRDSPRRAAGH